MKRNYLLHDKAGKYRKMLLKLLRQQLKLQKLIIQRCEFLQQHNLPLDTIAIDNLPIYDDVRIAEEWEGTIWEINETEDRIENIQAIVEYLGKFPEVQKDKRFFDMSPEEMKKELQKEMMREKLTIIKNDSFKPR